MQNLRAIAVSPVVQEFRTLTQRKHKRYIHKCHHRKANEKKKWPKSDDQGANRKHSMS